MKLKFKINKYYLISYTITSSHKPFAAWKRLEERIWQKHKDEQAYYFLNPKYIRLAIERIQIEISNDNIKNVFLGHALSLRKIYQEILRSPEFKRLYKETRQHLVFAKNQWEKNEKQVLKLLKEISGLSLPRREITVYITHPKSRNAKTINKNTIAYGRAENWKNYLTVYLCHELLHIITWPSHFQPNFDVLHAIIMLIDDELKFRLNKKGKYLDFKREELNNEVIKLVNLAKRILPSWKKYLTGDLGNNILELKDFLSKSERGHF